jgi:hypothetical protein
MRVKIKQDVLYHYLPRMDIARQFDFSDPYSQKCAEHVRLLADYIKATYEDTHQHLQSLRQEGKITYNRLWALFVPNGLVHTTCSSTNKSRCFKYIFGEKRTFEGVEHWYMEVQYPDYDGEFFGKMLIGLKIAKFDGAKDIHALEAFPLEFHPDYHKVRANLLECGQRFVALQGIHHRYYRGTAFSMNHGRPVTVPIDGGVIIDDDLFKKRNPDHPRTRFFDASKRSHGYDRWDLAYDQVASDTSSHTSDDGMEEVYCWDDDNLLVCPPTVLGFALKKNTWGECFDSID